MAQMMYRKFDINNLPTIMLELSTGSSLEVDQKHF